MRALFVTSEGPDPALVVAAWNSYNAKSARRVTFDVTGERRDASLIDAAKKHSPDVIFYMGGHAGPGQPSIDTLRELRAYAKSIHLCWDATDYPWHRTLREYKKKECFDLQVGIDGPLEAPVDMATISPISPLDYDTQPAPERNIRCAFAGQYGSGSRREAALLDLEERGNLCEIRQRTSGPYAEYANYLRRCQMIFNVGFTCAAQRLHINAKVVEAGLAGAAILEMTGGPLDHWFPIDSFFSYADIDEAELVIRTMQSDEISKRAALFSEIVRTKYSPKKIYGEMLQRVGL